MPFPLARATCLIAVASLLLAATAVPAAAATTCKGQRATQVGSPGNDEMVGTAKRDVIAGLGGNDFIEGLGGNDLVCGGGGADGLYGGGGGDVLVGGSGGDDVVGGGGSDTLLSGGASDYLNGGAGSDVINGGKPGFDYADFRSSTGPVVVDLAAGSATGDGDDVVKGIEMLSGSTFDDQLLGDDGDFELFLGLGGNDTIDGRGGFDQLIFDEATEGVSADIAAGVASGEGDDTFSSIESLVGSAFDDTLRGHEESDDIYGLEGNDTIDGRGGNDYLLGHAGDDEISGGPGEYDMIDFDPGAPAVTVDMTSGVATGEGSDVVSGFEIIGGSEFDDTLIGSDADELFYPYSGDDTIDGSGGEDLVLYNIAGAAVDADLSTGTVTGEGQDTVSAIEGFVGSPFADSLTGDDADNVLIGGPGGDSIAGGVGDDYMEGGAGSDELDGGEGTFDMADYYAAPQGVTADLGSGAATGDGTDALQAVEALLGSGFDDSFSGDAGANFLFGSFGDDELNGRDGDDGLDGGDGNDALDGGGGSDDCFAGETEQACETGAQTEPAIDVDALQALAEILGDVVGRGPG